MLGQRAGCGYQRLRKYDAKHLLPRHGQAKSIKQSCVPAHVCCTSGWHMCHTRVHLYDWSSCRLRQGVPRPFQGSSAGLFGALAAKDTGNLQANQRPEPRSRSSPSSRLGPVPFQGGRLASPCYCRCLVLKCGCRSCKQVPPAGPAGHGADTADASRLVSVFYPR